MVTASICNRMGNFVLRVSLVGSSLRMEASLLNFTPSLADLKRSKQEIVACLDCKIESLKLPLSNELSIVME